MIPVPPGPGPTVHPGEILLHEFMEPHGLSRNALARAIGVPVMRISKICSGTRGLTADTALRLARFFGTSPQFWLNLQSAYELAFAWEHEPEIEARVVPLELANA
jgi:addiction module HigA family antidote